MKRSRKTLNWSDRVSIFATRFDSPRTYQYRIQRAQEQIDELKLAYRNRTVSFVHHGETIRGKFVNAVHGDYPGTYMMVLRISSSRVCNGPCYVRLPGGRVGGIVVTGAGGLVGITARATARERTTIEFPSHPVLAHAA